MATVSVRDEVTELLQELIRVDTTNPPGNETAAAELLRDYLEDSGVRCDYLINEGSGERLELGGKPFYMCSVAEKMSAPFRMLVRGRSGHASMPGIADNALVKAAPLITKLGEHVPDRQLTPEVTALLETVTGSAPAAPEDAPAQAEEDGSVFAAVGGAPRSPTLGPPLGRA